MLHLSIKLGMIDGCDIIDKQTFFNSQTQITTTSCRIAKRMRVVGCGQETCITNSVLLRLAKDGTTVDFYLRESLLQFSLLRRSHIGELIDIDKQIVGKGHIAVELVAEVDMVEVVLTQMFRQKPYCESALATSLRPNQDRHTLIAVQRVHTHPMSNDRPQPDRAPRELFGRDARQSAKEFCNMILAVPLWKRIQVVANRIEGRNVVGADVFLNLLSWRLLASDSRFLGLANNGVKHLSRNRLPLGFSLIFGTDRSHFRLATQEVTAKLIILTKERLHLVDDALHLGHHLGRLRDKFLLVFHGFLFLRLVVFFFCKNTTKVQHFFHFCKFFSPKKHAKKHAQFWVQSYNITIAVYE